MLAWVTWFLMVPAHQVRTMRNRLTHASMQNTDVKSLAIKIITSHIYYILMSVHNDIDDNVVPSLKINIEMIKSNYL